MISRGTQVQPGRGASPDRARPRRGLDVAGHSAAGTAGPGSKTFWRISSVVNALGSVGYWLTGPATGGLGHVGAQIERGGGHVAGLLSPRRTSSSARQSTMGCIPPQAGITAATRARHGYALAFAIPAARLAAILLVPDPVLSGKPGSAVRVAEIKRTVRLPSPSPGVMVFQTAGKHSAITRTNRDWERGKRSHVMAARRKNAAELMCRTAPAHGPVPAPPRPPSRRPGAVRGSCHFPWHVLRLPGSGASGKLVR